MRCSNFSLSCAVFLALGAMASRAQAQVSFVDMFRVGSSLQTGNGNTLTPQGYFFAAELTSISAGNFTGVSLAYPGPASPVALSQNSPTQFAYQTALFANQAALDIAFPLGTYTFAATGGSAGPVSATLIYSANGYPSAQPFLTGTSYANLQGASATAPITLTFNGFTPSANTTNGYEFFSITDTASNSVVYNVGFLSFSTTSLTIAANTLLPNHNYSYNLDYSDRVSVAGANAQFAPFIGFDLSTLGTFRTAPAAVPEPGSITLLAGMGAMGAGFLIRRRKHTGHAA